MGNKLELNIDTITSIVDTLNSLTNIGKFIMRVVIGEEVYSFHLVFEDNISGDKIYILRSDYYIHPSTKKEVHEINCIKLFTTDLLNYILFTKYYRYKSPVHKCYIEIIPVQQLIKEGYVRKDLEVSE